jgi:diaminopimelate decarboxylase
MVTGCAMIADFYPILQQIHRLQMTSSPYMIGGLSALDLCAQHDTPLYVYDADKILHQYERLRAAFSGVKLQIKYACKALTNVSVMKLLRQAGAGLDVVSIQEAWLGLKAGFVPSEILFTPNCVSFEEIRMAVDLGLMINIDNISILEQFGNVYGGTVPVCVRINPHIVAGGNAHIQTGHIDSKFGISIHQMRHLQRVIESHGIKVIGLHMHSGSDILDARVFIQGAELLLDAAYGFKDLQFIDLGSGFKVAYKDDDVTTDIEELGKEMTRRFKEFCKEYGRQLELWFEPGKFLVSESGYLFVKVNVIKQTTATVFAGVDSGQNHLIRPMFYDAYHKISNVSNPEGTPRVYTVVGYICETDTFAWDRKIAEVREGDILCFHNAGAYGYSMSSNYNSRFRPAEVLVHKGEGKLIRRRETLDDLLRTQIEVEI